MAIWDQIDEAKAVLDALPPLTNGSLIRLDEEFSLQFNYNSNRIEGSTLTEQETRLVVKDGVSIKGKPVQDQFAAIGHQKAYAYLCDLLHDGPLLSEEIIRQAHRLVLMGQPEDAGQYRTVPVYIGNADVILPSPHLVPARMERLIREYQEKLASCHPVQAVAWMHLEFESIHPFVDGNGRTGRLILNYELMRQGYPPIDIKYADVERYYDCFRKYQGRDENPAPMEYMVAEYLKDALQRRIALVKESHRLRKKQER
jgi:Fic family protein